MAIDDGQAVLPQHRLYCFKRATAGRQGAMQRWAERAREPMTDYEVAAALAFEIHTVGGGCGPDTPSYEYNVSGLRVWGQWAVVNSFRDKPLWKGASTVAFAREVYGLRSPNDARQLTLFEIT